MNKSDDQMYKMVIIFDNTVGGRHKREEIWGYMYMYS